MTLDWRQALEPFALHYDQMGHILSTMDHAEIKAVIEAAKHPTSTNCWWATNAAAKWIGTAAQMELERRESLAAKLTATKGLT